MFDTAEIIFGCEAVLSYTLQEVMAYQDKLIERMRDKISESQSQLLSRIDEGSVKLYVSRTKLSHEKLYLLSAEDGRKRVIMGSANMSYNAFGGIQRENICYIDGDEAYDWYMFFRVDSIHSVTAGAVEGKPKEYSEWYDKFKENLWGVSTGIEHSVEHIEMTIHIEDNEGYIRERLEREKRCGHG